MRKIVNFLTKETHWLFILAISLIALFIVLHFIQNKASGNIVGTWAGKVASLASNQGSGSSSSAVAA